MIAFSAFINLFYLKKLLNTSSKMMIWLSNEIFRDILSNDYQTLENTKSSNYINILTYCINILSQGLASIFRIFSSSLNLIAIVVVLFVRDLSTALPLFTALIIAYLFLIAKTNKLVKTLGKENVSLNDSLLNKLKETFGSIRYIKISNTQPLFTSVFNQINRRARENQAKLLYRTQSPRFTVSSVVLIIIILIASFRLIYAENPDTALLEIFTVLIGSARLATPMQLIFVSLNKVSEASQPFKLVKPYLYNILKKNNSENHQPYCDFSDQEFSSLSLKNVVYQYPDLSNDFKLSANITINKGDKVAIIGKSGSGKSTIMDLMMGLLPPSKGSLLYNNTPVNNNNSFFYHTKITHVPQIPFLLNSDLIKNIIFSFDSTDIDPHEIYSVMSLACLDELIPFARKSSSIGEDGSKLSGGQRQRLAIARGIYNMNDILFLDEATSALDEQTERSILSNIFTQFSDLTIISITHRLETLKMYDKVIEVKSGTVNLIEDFAY